jgi:hypothetical protein
MIIMTTLIPKTFRIGAMLFAAMVVLLGLILAGGTVSLGFGSGVFGPGSEGVRLQLRSTSVGGTIPLDGIGGFDVTIQSRDRAVAFRADPLVNGFSYHGTRMRVLVSRPEISGGQESLPLSVPLLLCSNRGGDIEVSPSMLEPEDEVTLGFSVSLYERVVSKDLGAVDMRHAPVFGAIGTYSVVVECEVVGRTYKSNPIQVLVVAPPPAAEPARRFLAESKAFRFVYAPCLVPGKLSSEMRAEANTLATSFGPNPYSDYAGLGLAELVLRDAESALEVKRINCDNLLQESKKYLEAIADPSFAPGRFASAHKDLSRLLLWSKQMNDG